METEGKTATDTWCWVNIPIQWTESFGGISSNLQYLCDKIVFVYSHHMVELNKFMSYEY